MKPQFYEKKGWQITAAADIFENTKVCGYSMETRLRLKLYMFEKIVSFILFFI